MRFAEGQAADQRKLPGTEPVRPLASPLVCGDRPTPASICYRPRRVEGMNHSGARTSALVLMAWVRSAGGGLKAVEERLAQDRWAVIIFRPEDSDALWVRPGEYLILDERRRSRFEVLSGEEFNRCFERSDGVDSGLVRECPIFDDGEVA